MHLQKYGILIKQSSLDLNSKLSGESSIKQLLKNGGQNRETWWTILETLESFGKPEHLSFYPNTHIQRFLASKQKFVKRRLFSGNVCFPCLLFWGEARKFLYMMNRIRLNISGRTDFFQVIFDHRFWCRKISHRPPGSSKPSTLHKVCQATPSKTHSNGTIVYLPLDVSYKLTKCRYIHHTYIIFHHMYPYIGKVFTASLKAPNKNI